jgi:hypothetical protein
VSASPRMPASSGVLWLLATSLIALSPLLFFITGADGSATTAYRIRVAAIPALVAWPLLVLAVGLVRRRRGLTMGLVIGASARRAVLLMAVAAGVLAGAYVLGSTAAIEGDTAWTLYWVVVGSLWVALSASSLRRPRDHG